MDLTLAITRRLPEAVETRARAGYRVIQDTVDGPRTGADVLRICAGADALLCCPAERIDATAVAALPACVRVVATFSVGTDHLDLAALAARGIAVVNTPDVLSIATAELSLLLILMAARRAGEGERLVRAGAWGGWHPTHMMGTGVTGRRIGILGMGRIGRELATMARGLGMTVHYRNRARLDPALEDGASFHDTDATFLPACDVLSLNAPGGAGTRHWLDAGRIARLPWGAVVANAARGTLIDDDALIAALRSGRIAAAGLDVYGDEPRVDPRYLALNNVVLLPHLGSATVATRDAMGFAALDGIDAALHTQSAGNWDGNHE